MSDLMTAEVRAQIARTIDPYAFRDGSPVDRMDEGYRKIALAKADTILALLVSVPVGGLERLRQEAAHPAVDGEA